MNADDPSCVGGYVQIYQIQKVFSISTKQLQFNDSIMMRLFRNVDAYKLQLTSQTNMNFYYKCIMNSYQFSNFVSSNKIQINYAEFPEWFKKLFADQLSFKFEIHTTHIAKLIIIKPEKYKQYEIASFNFAVAEKEELKESIMFRYQRMQTRLGILKQYWNSMTSLIKTKNPSLYMSIVKGNKKNSTAFK